MDKFKSVIGNQENRSGQLKEWRNLTIILHKMRDYIKERPRGYSKAQRLKKFTAVIYERP